MITAKYGGAVRPDATELALLCDTPPNAAGQLPIAVSSPPDAPLPAAPAPEEPEFVEPEPFAPEPERPELETEEPGLEPEDPNPLVIWGKILA